MVNGKEYLERPFTKTERDQVGGILPDEVIDLLEKSHEAGKKELMRRMAEASHRVETGVGIGPYFLSVLSMVMFVAVPIFAEKRAPSIQEVFGLLVGLALGACWIAWYYRKWQLEYLRAYATQQSFFFVIADRRGDWYEGKIDNILEREREAIRGIEAGLDDLKVLIAKLPSTPECEQVKREMNRTWNDATRMQNKAPEKVVATKPGEEPPHCDGSEQSLEA